MTDDVVRNAVRTLRLYRVESQQQFSEVLGIVMSTVVRYELTRAPSGAMLYRLAHLAHKSERPDLRDVFIAKLRDEAGIDLDHICAFCGSGFIEG